MKNDNLSTGGVGFLGLLTLLFIGLKLGHIISWTWFWVLSPILLPIIIILWIAVIVVTLWVIFGDR